MVLFFANSIQGKQFDVSLSNLWEAMAEHKATILE